MNEPYGFHLDEVDVLEEIEGITGYIFESKYIKKIMYKVFDDLYDCFEIAVENRLQDLVKNKDYWEFAIEEDYRK